MDSVAHRALIWRFPPPALMAPRVSGGQGRGPGSGSGSGSGPDSDSDSEKRCDQLVHLGRGEETVRAARRDVSEHGPTLLYSIRIDGFGHESDSEQPWHPTLTHPAGCLYSYPMVLVGIGRSRNAGSHPNLNGHRRLRRSPKPTEGWVLAEPKVRLKPSRRLGSASPRAPHRADRGRETQSDPVEHRPGGRYR